MEITIALLALLLSLIALGWQTWTYFRQRTEQLTTQNLTAMAELERSLADSPRAFAFFGLTEEIMKRHGFEPSELAFLVSHFTVGGIFHRLKVIGKGNTFPTGSYRYQLCSNERVRDAWPLIERMLANTAYKRRVVNTLRAIHGTKFYSTFEEVEQNN